MGNSVNIVLNGQIVRASSDESILDVANRNNISIPTLCNDPRIEPYTSCYVCVVEVEGMKGLQPSCSTKVREGMQIRNWLRGNTELGKKLDSVELDDCYVSILEEAIR